jgi:carbamoylphosphate synthase small subunit
MTGYREVAIDPHYPDRVVLTTPAHIGSCGAPYALTVTWSLQAGERALFEVNSLQEWHR